MVRIEAEGVLLPLLDAVEEGMDVAIMRGGEVVATLVAVADRRRDADAAAADLRALRAEIAARGERFTWDEVRAWRDDGRP